MNGLVPKEAKDQQNKSTMRLRDICNMHPEEHHLHDCRKFSSRLSRLRKKIRNLNSRAEDDQRAFDLFVANHPVSLVSSKGCIQWQGSAAQTQAKKDLEDGKLEVGNANYKGYRELCENTLVHNNNFPFKEWSDKK